MRTLRLLCAVFVALALLVGAARAQDAVPSKAEQVRRIHQLPTDEKRRLKEALERFNALPAAERDALRRKAREVGVERLGELAGRNFEGLKRRHEVLQREMNEVMKLLGGPDRLAGLSVEERGYLRYLALRNFQVFWRAEMLRQANLGNEFGTAAPAERRERMRKAADHAVASILEERTPQEQSRFRDLAPAIQRRERADLLAEWRMRLTVPFAKNFEHYHLLPLLAMPAEKRHDLLEKKIRWFQLANLVQSDGADRDTLKMLGHLTADERAQVALLYEQSQDLPPLERRSRVVDKIRELYGAGAVDADRPQRPMPRLRDLFRDRALRERHAGDPAAAPPATK